MTTAYRFISSSTSTSSSWKLPLLDIRQFDSDPTHFVEQLRHSCHNIGFFLLRHDIPTPICQRALNETRHFFERPLDQKMQISYDQHTHFRGYMKLGVENTAGRLDYREQVEYAAEESVSKTALGGDEAFYNRLRGQNPWPNQVQPTLKPAILDVVQHMTSVADRIRKGLCLALQLEASALDDLFATDTEPSHWVLKMVAYPPMASQAVSVEDGHSTTKSEGAEDPSLGVGAHTDTNFLTLILQDTTDASRSGVLQVFSQGQWRSVPLDMADSSVLICNLGEQAQVWSGSYFLATPHRVLLGVTNPSSSNNSPAPVGRISLPLFYNPRLSARIPLISEATVDALPWEREQDRHDWIRSTPDKMLTLVGENTFKSLARSHPAVFQRHHPDLTLLEDGRIVFANHHEKSEINDGS